MTLRIANLKQAFPVSCSYQLELRAYKRTIDSCDHDFDHRNLSQFSLTVKVKQTPATLVGAAVLPHKKATTLPPAPEGWEPATPRGDAD